MFIAKGYHHKQRPRRRSNILLRKNMSRFVRPFQGRAWLHGLVIINVLPLRGKKMFRTLVICSLEAFYGCAVV